MCFHALLELYEYCLSPPRRREQPLFDHARRAGRTVGAMARRVDVVSQKIDLEIPTANGAQVAAAHVPDSVIARRVFSPVDLEKRVGITEGNIFHGELTMDQLLFNRPIPGYAQYRGPVDGLYMCGSSTHPGGGVMGAPGANAAREILADLKRPNTVPENFGDD